MQRSDASTATARRQRTVLLVGICALGMAIAWGQWRIYASTQSRFETSIAQLSAMQGDAAAILSLKEATPVAVGQARTSQELLHQVEKALSSSGIDRSLWSDSVPQGAIRVPETDYQRAGVRLYFAGLTMQQLAGFSYQIELIDPTLEISAVNLTNRENESPKFDVDVTVSYLVFSPTRE